jgi:hypothetical protein
VIFDPDDGQWVGTIGSLEATPWPLVNPTAVALDALAGEVLVSDYGDPLTGEGAAVKIYDLTGTYLGAVCGDSGQEGFAFSRPQGLGVSADGQILVADSLLGQVLVFDRTTSTGIATLGSYGTDPGQLRLPLDLEIEEAAATVWVTNNRLGRLEAFPWEAVQP